MTIPERAIEAALPYVAQTACVDAGICPVGKNCACRMNAQSALAAALPSLMGVKREDVARAKQIAEAWDNARAELAVTKSPTGAAQVWKATDHWPTIYPDEDTKLFEGDYAAVDEWVELYCARAVLALALSQHTRQQEEGWQQEGWRTDLENAPTEAYEFFLVRQVGIHSGSGRPFIPAIVQQIDGQLFAPDNELDPLIFGHGQPKPDWHDAGLEWRPLPADWLSPASPRAEGEKP